MKALSRPTRNGTVSGPTGRARRRHPAVALRAVGRVVVEQLDRGRAVGRVGHVRLGGLALDQVHRRRTAAGVQVEVQHAGADVEHQVLAGVGALQLALLPVAVLEDAAALVHPGRRTTDDTELDRPVVEDAPRAEPGLEVHRQRTDLPAGAGLPGPLLRAVRRVVVEQGDGRLTIRVVGDVDLCCLLGRHSTCPRFLSVVAPAPTRTEGPLHCLTSQPLVHVRTLSTVCPPLSARLVGGDRTETSLCGA